MHIFCNKMLGTVAVHVGVTAHSVNSKRFFDTLISEECVSYLECFSFSCFPLFIQTVAVQSNSTHLNGRFINVRLQVLLRGFYQSPF